jgi:adenylate cyclase class IV
MRNVEAKFRCDAAQWRQAREAALGLGARPAGTLRQVDTYFYAPRGRLKLREITEDGHPPLAVLIGYGRPDATGARTSDYEMAAIPDPGALLAALERALGRRTRVEKAREVLLLRHTRIHLDDVRDLGTFVELETLVGAADARRGDAAGAPDTAEAARELAEIAETLGMRVPEGLAGSYADLLEHAEREARATSRDGEAGEA